MELCPTLEIIGGYFTKSLQGYQFCRFHNIILGIHEDDIPYYNTSRIAPLERRNIKQDIEKEEAYKSAKLEGD